MLLILLHHPRKSRLPLPPHPPEAKHNLSVTQNSHPLAYTQLVNVKCLRFHTHHRMQTNVLECKSHPHLETPHPKSLPETHYSYPAHAHKCCLPHCANRLSRARALGPNASFRILTLQLLAARPQCPSASVENKIGIIILILKMDVTIK